ncbi:hypothetical protein BH09BAC5_BH09BAC5_02560 [soil metagenome]
MLRISFSFLLVTFSFFCFSQNLPQSRKTDWTYAGINHVVNQPATQINIMSFGADASGVIPSDVAIQAAIASLNGNAGVINFPAGVFLFNASISLTDSIILHGAGSANTLLQFDLNGNGDLISVTGSSLVQNNQLVSDAVKDSSFIELTNISNYSIGDYVRIYQNDSALVFSNWAYNTVGQIIHVNNIIGNKLYFDGMLRKDYLLTDSCKFEKCLMKKSVGIECLKIERLDTSAGQTTNIAFNYAVDCWVTGIESNNCNFGHLVFTKSSNCYVYGNYFHHAFAYGGNGQGYGVVLQYCTGECLVENNIFNHLRHSMLLQAGANGNVCTFNYSRDPYWTSFPSNSAGDIVLHGNYVFMNLFEENIVQNIVVDASHGINGPYNTFFRNRAELFGIVMTVNPSSDNQNYIGNEITNTNFGYGQYTLNGNGHFQFGNNKQGNCVPANTTNVTDVSYFYNSTPWFLTSGYVFPAIGYSNTINSNSIPSKDRYMNSDYTICGTILTGQSDVSLTSTISIFPNPASDHLFVNVKHGGAYNYSIFGADGKLVSSGEGTGKSEINVADLTNGIYFLTVNMNSNEIFTQRFVISK